MKERERSSSSNKGLQRKKLETVALPVTQLTSPDRVKKREEIKEGRGGNQEGKDEGLKKKRGREHKLR